MTRKILFWIHLCSGAVAGVVILTMSVTGVLLVFERQIIAWADRDFKISSNGAQRRPIDVLLPTAQDALRAAPNTITIRADAVAPVEFSLGRDRTVFVDPYRATVLGEGSQPARAFFTKVENIHRWLGVSAENRPTGRAITGACNLAFLVLVATGPFLWWPRTWTLANLKRIIFFTTAKPGRAMFWNWHHVLGAWCVVPLLVIVATGTIMSYRWANDLLYRATGNQPPQQQGPPAGEKSGERSDRSAREQREHHGEEPRKAASIDSMFSKAAERVPDWKSMSLRMPASARAPLTFTIDQGTNGRPDLRSQLTFDRQSGEVTRWEPFAQNNLGRRLRIWARFSHTGEAFGWFGQTVAALASLSAALLVLSGLALTWIRLRTWKKRSRRTQEIVLEEEISRCA